MKKLLIPLLLISPSLFARSVSFKIEHKQIKQGNVLVAIFNDPKEFPDGKSIFRQISTANPNGMTEIKLELQDGEYAAAVFLDENKNNKLDKNILGIPKEMFGFSNNPKILTGPPTFYESEIVVSDSESNFKIKLIKLL